MGGDLNGLRDIKPFNEMKGVWHAWARTRELPSQFYWMCLIINNENIYVFMGGDLNGFWDIRNFKNCLGLGIPPGQPMSLKFQILNFVEYF